MGAANLGHAAGRHGEAAFTRAARGPARPDQRGPSAGLSPPELGGGSESRRKVGGAVPTRPERVGLTSGASVWLETVSDVAGSRPVERSLLRCVCAESCHVPGVRESSKLDSTALSGGVVGWIHACVEWSLLRCFVPGVRGFRTLRSRASPTLRLSESRVAAPGRRRAELAPLLLPKGLSYSVRCGVEHGRRHGRGAYRLAASRLPWSMARLASSSAATSAPPIR